MQYRVGHGRLLDRSSGANVWSKLYNLNCERHFLNIDELEKNLFSFIRAQLFELMVVPWYRRMRSLRGSRPSSPGWSFMQLYEGII